MITEEEFYKEKIFKKIPKNDLKRLHPNQSGDIENWYRSDRYKKIQDYKSFLLTKFKTIMTSEKEVLVLSPEQFYELFCWWEKQPEKCFYCSLPESDLEILHNQDGHINKRYPYRGKSLEIDRKLSNLPYTDIDNLVLVCYWCNNAKTDTFTEVEFSKVGEVLKTIWEDRLKKQL